MNHSILDVNSGEFEALTRDLLAEGKIVRFRAKGFSMRPFIHNGDLLEVQPIGDYQVKIGDIILFKSLNNGLLAHRIIKIKAVNDETMYLPQGDSNRHPDLLISSAQFLGIIVACKRDQKDFDFTTRAQQVIARLWVLFSPLLKRFYYFISGTK